MTFTLPENLADEFLRAVPGSQRSQYVATAIAAKLREREERHIHACEIANGSADVLEIETSMDALADKADGVQEPW